jgi:hypothetical protein
MGRLFHGKTAWSLAVCLLLAHASPAGAGSLVCIAEEADPGCCDEAPVPAQSLDGFDCDCCVTVEGVANRANATTKKIAVDVSSAAGDARSPVSPTAARVAPASGDPPGNPGLPSLRTVVLQI